MILCGTQDEDLWPCWSSQSCAWKENPGQRKTLGSSYDGCEAIARVEMMWNATNNDRST